MFSVFLCIFSVSVFGSVCNLVSSMLLQQIEVDLFVVGSADWPLESVKYFCVCIQYDLVCFQLFHHLFCISFLECEKNWAAN